MNEPEDLNVHDPGGRMHGFTPITQSNCPPVETADDYLSEQNVRSFLEYLASLVREPQTLRHSYKHADEGYEWQCTGLLDAAKRYSFPIVEQFWVYTGKIDVRSLSANAVVHNHLKGQLREALAGGPPKDARARAAAAAILHWGGTEIQGNHNLDALETLAGRPEGFVGYIELCRRSFSSGRTFDLSLFKDSAYGFRSSAGFTKIYSLAFDDFVIYDSRVAAALGLLVIRWWALQRSKNSSESTLPESLRFLCMPSQDDQRRNPNSNWFGITGFPKSYGNHIRHIQANIRANWLLKRVVTDSAFEREVSQHPHPYQVEPLRALEAALFMIGYDLAGNWPHVQ